MSWIVTLQADNCLSWHALFMLYSLLFSSHLERQIFTSSGYWKWGLESCFHLTRPDSVVHAPISKNLFGKGTRRSEKGPDSPNE